jgi:glycine dehydrogenase
MTLKHLVSNRPFTDRHLGIREEALEKMLKRIGAKSVEEMISRTVPSGISLNRELDLPSAVSEESALSILDQIASKNEVWKSYIGHGYYNCFVPSVIQRNILENPGWYTQYTPYQAEISQGRLEALLNFQTMVSDLTGLEISNASLLDEATAAAEAMAMSFEDIGTKNKYLVHSNTHKQTIDVLRTRAKFLGVKIELMDSFADVKLDDVFGALISYPGSDGKIFDPTLDIQRLKSSNAVVTLATDLMALMILKSPGSMQADIAVGSAQRFGVPLGFGGPHAAFISCRSELKRRIPGRIVGLSKDKNGRPAIRLALQTREQHIRREKATSNICTAQVLLAIMSSMYAVYHGQKGLLEISSRIHTFAKSFFDALSAKNYSVINNCFFDTVGVKVSAEQKSKIVERAKQLKINVRQDLADRVLVSFDETTNLESMADLAKIFEVEVDVSKLIGKPFQVIQDEMLRKDPPLSQPIFNRYHSEHELLRYIKNLESKDLSMTSGMIPLGSCTMKLNATSELFPVSWRNFNGIHPFAPIEQVLGYQEMFDQLSKWLAEITGFAAVSLQPNSGSQGEYAGLLSIRGYLESIGQSHRNICLIPQSAHGTNPATASMLGMKIVPVSCDSHGNIDIADLKSKIDSHRDSLACIMVTYPSTHGVFEESIATLCTLIHDAGGQVYMDGANMNAQVGLCRPGDFGPDVCHLNLHKTFCIPHGGGGPGMGPIAVAKHLKPFLPGHWTEGSAKNSSGDFRSVAAARWGSASILPISWMYIRMMGPGGLKKATQTAILNANYIASRLNDHFPILYRGKNGFIAHECIIDLRPVKASANIEVDDIAKRLMDYGFHAPTVSFPVPGTMMIEPTESESFEELERFCDAMVSIRREITKVEKGEWSRDRNVLKMAPHTIDDIVSDTWEREYSREVAVYPGASSKSRKFWPAVSRIDAAFGDRNLICSCPDLSEYSM